MKTPWRVVLLLVILSLVVLYLGHTLGGRAGLFIASSTIIVFHLLSFFLGELRLIHIFNSREIMGQDEWGLSHHIQELCEKARIPAPRLHRFDEYAPLVLVTGRNWDSSQVVLSSGFLDQLSKDEQRTLLALAVSRIKRQQVLSTTYASALSGGLSQWLKPTLMVSQAQKPSFFNWLTRLTQTLLVRVIYRPSEVFQDDLLAAELVGDSHKVARLLWKIDGQLRSKPLNIPPSLAHLFMVSPLTTQKKFRYFLSQPAVKSRIIKLTGGYPI